MEHKQLHSKHLRVHGAKKHVVHTRRQFIEHSVITYISIQPVGKPMGRLTNSLELLTMEKKTGVINADLISNNKLGGGGGAKGEG